MTTSTVSGVTIPEMNCGSTMGVRCERLSVSVEMAEETRPTEPESNQPSGSRTTWEPILATALPQTS